MRIAAYEEERAMPGCRAVLRCLITDA